MRDNTQVQMEDITLTPEGNAQDQNYRLRIQYRGTIYESLINQSVFHSDCVEIEDLEKILLEGTGKSTTRLDDNLTIYTIFEENFTEKCLKITIEFDLKIGKLKRKKETMNILLPKKQQSIVEENEITAKMVIEYFKKHKSVVFESDIKKKIETLEKVNQVQNEIIQSMTTQMHELQAKITKLESTFETKNKLLEKEESQIKSQEITTKTKTVQGSTFDNSSPPFSQTSTKKKFNTFDSNTWSHLSESERWGQLIINFTKQEVYFPELKLFYTQESGPFIDSEFAKFAIHEYFKKESSECSYSQNSVIQQKFQNYFLNRRIIELSLNYVCYSYQVKKFELYKDTPTALIIKFYLPQNLIGRQGYHLPWAKLSSTRDYKYQLIRDGEKWEYFQQRNSFNLLQKLEIPSFSESLYFVELLLK